jgi:hypothetical protein
MDVRGLVNTSLTLARMIENEKARDAKHLANARCKPGSWVGVAAYATDMCHVECTEEEMREAAYFYS